MIFYGVEDLLVFNPVFFPRHYRTQGAVQEQGIFLVFTAQRKAVFFGLLQQMFGIVSFGAVVQESGQFRFVRVITAQFGNPARPFGRAQRMIIT